MSESQLPDLLSLQRSLLSQWEKGLNELLVKQMSTSEFSKQANQALSASPQLKKSLEKLQELTLNMPSTIPRPFDASQPHKAAASTSRVSWTLRVQTPYRSLFLRCPVLDAGLESSTCFRREEVGSPSALSQ